MDINMPKNAGQFIKAYAIYCIILVVTIILTGCFMFYSGMEYRFVRNLFIGEMIALMFTFVFPLLSLLWIFMANDDNFN